MLLECERSLPIGDPCSSSVDFCWDVRCIAVVRPVHAQQIHITLAPTLQESVCSYLSLHYLLHQGDMADDEHIAQTLHVAREVSIYRVPPRHGADGYRSGSWLTGDKIFSGRLRVVGAQRRLLNPGPQRIHQDPERNQWLCRLAWETSVKSKWKMQAGKLVFFTCIVQ